MKVLVTGANGFVGRNLCAGLRTLEVAVIPYDLQTPHGVLVDGLSSADIVYHLAGVNRPQLPAEFARVNAGFTQEICAELERRGRTPTIVLASSTQAELDNPYGASKRAAEEELRRFCAHTGATGVVYRLKNLFGKWCRPNYNSVTATICHNVARGLPIQLSNAANEIDLTYIDDVVAAFIGELDSAQNTGGGYRMAPPLAAHRTTLGELASLVRSFREIRATLCLPDFSQPFVRALYATYLSYVPPEDVGYHLRAKTDSRGSLAEFLKSPSLGQLFVSRTRAGVTRGNHYHQTKVEKFLVVEGEAAIRLRSVNTGELVEIRVRGTDFQVVDIPPGYAHSIENNGPGDLVTLFWASEPFDAGRPDTLVAAVLPKEGTCL